MQNGPFSLMIYIYQKNVFFHDFPASELLVMERKGTVTPKEKFKSGNLMEARDYYREAIVYVEDLVDARRKERNELLMPLYSNLAQASLLGKCIERPGKAFLWEVQTRSTTLWWTNIAMENGHRNSGFSH